ncbi:50S ribosomal protein L27 [Candidatus Gottesmanbacteria bacterium]|nr:50S ribosomal protein L27 [Candidatus Gottesmanbacteria bacterium]
MAHIKTGGTTKGNRDSQGQRLGVKRFGGEKVINGNIIVRQKGNKFYSGNGVKTGKDFTLYAVNDGRVNFRRYHSKTLVDVVPNS